MVSSLSSLLVRPGRRRLAAAVPVVAFGVTFVGYAVGVFAVSGGVIFLAAQAAYVAFAAAAVAGFVGSGLVFGWLGAAAGLLGQHADHHVFGRSYLPPAERLLAMLEPDSLAVLGVQALGIALLGWSAGVVFRVGVGKLRNQ